MRPQHPARGWPGLALAGLVAAWLLGAAAPAAPPAVDATGPVPGAPPVAPARRPAALAGNEAIADQFAMLAFDADPVVGGVPRTRLARWQGPVRLFVSGDAAALHTAEQIAGPLARLTGLPFLLVAGGAPNLLVAVSPDPPAIFAGPLRRLLLAAFDGDDAAADAFTETVIKAEPCWMLAVWGDPDQTIVRAAVIGIDAHQTPAGVARCMARKFAAAMGLLGPSGYLPRSVFAPQSAATRYSGEDTLMLRLLFSAALHPGMTRDEAQAAAMAALPGLRHR